MKWLGLAAVLLAAAAHGVNPAVRSIARLDPSGFEMHPATLALNLIRSAGLLAAAAVLLGACHAGGRIALRLLRVSHRPAAGFTVAAGLLVASLAVFGLGLTGLLSRPVLGAALIAGVLLAFRARAWRVPVAAWRSAPAGSLRPGWLLLPAVPSLVGAPLLPVTDVDMLEYHAGLPALWLLHHRIHYEPAHLLMTMPLGMERLLAPFEAFGIGGAMAWLHAVLVAIAGATVGSALARCGVRGAAWGGWLVIGWGAALHLGAAGHPDTGLVLAAALLCRAVVSGSALELGIACALAAATKYQGLVLAAAFFAAALPRSGSVRGIARPAVTAGAVALLPNLPWLLRNAWLTGNPVFPFFSGVLPSLGWSPWNDAVLWGSMRNASIEIDWLFPAEAVTRYAAAFWTGVSSGWFTAHAALVYVLLPVPFLRVAPPVRRMAVAGVLFALVWLLPVPKFGRYLVPGLVPVLAVWWTAVAALPAGVARAATAVVIVTQALTVPAAWAPDAVSASRVLAGGATPADAARAGLGIWLDVTRWINHRPAPGRTLVIGHGYGVGLARPWRSANETGRPAWLAAAGLRADPVRLRIGLRQAGIGRVLYNPVRAFHRSGYWAGYGFTDDWIRSWTDLWRRYGVVERPPQESDWTGAWFVWTLASRPHPPVPPPWVPGVEWLMANEYDLAAGRHDPAALARQRRLLPDVAASKFQAGVAVARRSRAQAIRDVGAAVRDGVGLPGAWRVYAELLAGAGRNAEAVAALRRALAIEPGHRGARDELARLEGLRPGPR